MFGVLTDHPDHPFPFHNLALVTDFFYRCPDFHSFYPVVYEIEWKSPARKGGASQHINIIHIVPLSRLSGTGNVPASLSNPPPAYRQVGERVIISHEK